MDRQTDDEQTDPWIEGRTDRRWIDGWMDGLFDLKYVRTDRWMYGWLNGWTMNIWMN